VGWRVDWLMRGAIVGVLLTAPHAAHEAAAQASITVRVYNNFGVDPEDLKSARDIAQGILRDAGIDVVWLDCWFRRSEPADAAPACRQPLTAADIVMRLQSGNAEIGTRIVSIGFSLIGAGPERPYLATVFPDVVRSVARGAGTDPRQVLGFAIAHEIGHLMLNTNEHAHSGLMRAGWSRNELRRNAQSDWRFLEEEGTTMRAAIAAR